MRAAAVLRRESCSRVVAPQLKETMLLEAAGGSGRVASPRTHGTAWCGSVEAFWIFFCAWPCRGCRAQHVIQAVLGGPVMAKVGAVGESVWAMHKQGEGRGGRPAPCRWG